MKSIKIRGFSIGGKDPLVFIMGPCVIEDEKTVFKTLEGLLRITGDLGVSFVFKASYDKANRTSVRSFRGPGLKKGLKVLKKAGRDFSVPLLTDVHCKHEIKEVAEVVDVIQVPAFLSRQTDLLVAAARSGRVVNIKKGQFMAPHDVKHSIEKVLSAGSDRITVTERGVSFGYNNLVVDCRAFPVLRSFGFPVIFDATHSVQTPAGLGASSGGDRTMARYLGRAAAGAGVDGFFMEVHPRPDRALCDGPNSIALKDVKTIIEELVEIDGIARRSGGKE